MRQHDRRGTTTRRRPTTLPIKQHRTGCWSITGGDPVTSRSETASRRRDGHTARYPALEAWRKRVGDTASSRWTLDNLWRAAIAEVEASENHNHPEREQRCQCEAIAPAESFADFPEALDDDDEDASLPF